MVCRARSAGCGSTEGDCTRRTWNLLDWICQRAHVPWRANCANCLSSIRLSSWLASYFSIETSFRVGAHIACGAVGALHRNTVNVLACEALDDVLALFIKALKPSRALRADSLAFVGIVAWCTFDHVLVWMLALVACRAQFAIALASDRKGPWSTHFDGVKALCGAIVACWAWLQMNENRDRLT